MICKGITNKGINCKRNILKGTYCHNHKSQGLCIGITKNGDNCKKKVSNNNKFCNIHTKKWNNEKPNECPICFEPMNEKRPLECGHWIHRSCILKSNKCECAICRKVLMEKYIVTNMKPLEIIEEDENIDNINININYDENGIILELDIEENTLFSRDQMEEIIELLFNNNIFDF